MANDESTERHLDAELKRYGGLMRETQAPQHAREAVLQAVAREEARTSTLRALKTPKKRAIRAIKYAEGSEKAHSAHRPSAMRKTAIIAIAAALAGALSVGIAFGSGAPWGFRLSAAPGENAFSFDDAGLARSTSMNGPEGSFNPATGCYDDPMSLLAYRLSINECFNGTNVESITATAEGEGLWIERFTPQDNFTYAKSATIDFATLYTGGAPAQGGKVGLLYGYLAIPANREVAEAYNEMALHCASESEEYEAAYARYTAEAARQASDELAGCSIALDIAYDDGTIEHALITFQVAQDSEETLAGYLADYEAFICENATLLERDAGEDGALSPSEIEAAGGSDTALQPPTPPCVVTASIAYEES